MKDFKKFLSHKKCLHYGGFTRSCQCWKNLNLSSKCKHPIKCRDCGMKYDDWIKQQQKNGWK